MAHLYIVALLANKWIGETADADSLRKTMDGFLESVFASISNPPASDDTTGEKLRVIFWIAKAMVVRGDKYGMDITAKLVELLGNNNYGPMASKGFAVLLGEDEFLNKENYAIIRLLTKQRVFSFCVPKIVDGFKSAGSGNIKTFLHSRY
jgi:DNA repair/transcription protein MET18/MMS19